jgi:secreted trypsin-like serine protease
MYIVVVSADNKLLLVIQAQVGRYSYVVRLNMGSNGKELDSPYCGGILVAPDTVITAAQCVEYGSLDYVAIGKKSNITCFLVISKLSLISIYRNDTGGHTMDNWEGENIAMSNITIHPDWDWWTTENDFAVVILERATKLKIKYPTLNTKHSFPSVDTLATVIGWGTTESGSQSNVLMEADLPIISNKDCDQCQSQFGGHVTPDMICGFDLGQGSCYGDSGEYKMEIHDTL